MEFPIEKILERWQEEALFHSSGTFSQDNAAAIEKLAAYRLPGPDAWLGKVVQAFVANGAGKISLVVDESFVCFVGFDCGPWSREAFTENFLSPARLERASFEHPVQGSEVHQTGVGDPHRPREGWAGLEQLKQGLWSVAVGEKQPFFLFASDWTDEVQWDGQQFHPPTPLLSTLWHEELSVEHPEGSRLAFLLVPIGKVRDNWVKKDRKRKLACLEEFRKRTFACPIPVLLNGNRVDGLHLCPGHGYSDSNFPVQIQCLEGAGYTLLTPSGSRNFDYPEGLSGSPALLNSLDRYLELPEQFQIAILLTVHHETGGKEKVAPCRVYWISDGVLVDSEDLHLPHRACSLGLICSAEGLNTDLSGLTLQRNQAYFDRLESAIRRVDSWLESARLDMDDFECEIISNNRILGRVFTVAGVLGGVLFSPAWGLLALCGFGMVKNSESRGSRETEKLRLAFQDLQADWPNCSARPK